MNRKAIALAAATLLLCGCKKEVFDYRYKVICASCEVTYINPNGDTQQRTVSGGWDLDLGTDAGGYLYVSAQSNNQSGSVSVYVLNGDAQLASGNCSSAYCIATASKSVR
jgi:hypothetical protein